MSAPKVYQIRSLQDIFALPTCEQMKRCLAEISEAMLVARAQNDMLVELARSEGREVPDVALEFPDVSEWTDDGKRDLDLEFESQDGRPLFKIEGREGNIS